jgi:hypothetical protein
MEQNVSRHIKCNPKRTLLSGTVDKASEIGPEVPYRSSAHEEAGGHIMARLDSSAQLGDPDVDHASNKTGKLRLSTKCSII